MFAVFSNLRLRGRIFREDTLVRDRLASIFHLMSGNAGNALVMLLGVTIAARSLGVDQFGVMVLVLTIGRVCERLVRFESWQPLVRFIAEEEKAGGPQRLAELYLFGFLLDVSSALLAALLAILCAFLFSGILGLGPSGVGLVAIYACALAVNIRGMPSAAFRLAGRFKMLAYFQLFANCVRVALAAACYLTDAGLMAFVLVWTAAQMLDSLLFIFFGFRIVRQSGVPCPLRADWHHLHRKFPGFLGFAFSTNLSSMLRTLTHEVDTLIVGAFAGSGAAGLYHLAKRMAKLAQQVGDLIQTVVYPDLSRMWSVAQQLEFRRLVVAVQLSVLIIAATVFAAVWLGGEPLIELVFGKGYRDIYPLLLAQTVAVAFIMHAAPSRSALLAMNQPRYVLSVAALATVLFFAISLSLVPTIGAIGANLAHIAYGGVTALLLDVAFWKRSRSDKAVSEKEEKVLAERGEW